ncbi:putative FY-rich, partial [Pseudoloma neurophilia]
MLDGKLLKELFQKRYETHLKKIKMYKKLKESNIHPFAVNKQVTHAPIILGSSSTRMSILNLGEVLKDNKFYNRLFIYPLNFMCKRKYRSYKPTKRASIAENSQESKNTTKDDKIFYCMTIHENGCTISSDDKEWETWADFVKEFEQNDMKSSIDTDTFLTSDASQPPVNKDTNLPTFST